MDYSSAKGNYSLYLLTIHYSVFYSVYRGEEGNITFQIIIHCLKKCPVITLYIFLVDKSDWKNLEKETYIGGDNLRYT